VVKWVDVMPVDRVAASSDESFAGRLDRLFATVRKPDGGEYSLREVADKITQAGTPISHTYIGQLRSGGKDDPKLSHMRALARFFGVPVEYFTSDGVASAVDAELDLLVALQQVRARQVALRESVLPEARATAEALTVLLERVRHLENRRSRRAADES
jgi:transcriptional regulator with XRE-family HTH domain